jgi:hypothetical protein
MLETLFRHLLGKDTHERFYSCVFEDRGAFTYDRGDGARVDCVESILEACDYRV